MTRDAAIGLEAVAMVIESNNGLATAAAGQTVVNLEVTTAIGLVVASKYGT